MRLVVLIVAFCCCAASASAQIAATTPGRQRAENRRALRDSRKYPAEYKESHLAVNRTSFKRGESGQPVARHDGREKFQFDNTGTPRVSEPMRFNLRLHGRKK